MSAVLLDAGTQDSWSAHAAAGSGRGRCVTSNARSGEPASVTAACGRNPRMPFWLRARLTSSPLCLPSLLTRMRSGRPGTGADRRSISNPGTHDPISPCRAEPTYTNPRSARPGVRSVMFVSSHAPQVVPRCGLSPAPVCCSQHWLCSGPGLELKDQ